MTELTDRGKQIRRDTIKLAKANGGYHWGGSFSCVEILIALFDHVMGDDDRMIMNDQFVLSKGHACWPYYVILRERGLHPKLEGHPTRDPYVGIHCSTGSLGHGFPLAVGMALAKKLKGEKGRVFVLMGDGECQEGTTWESILIAGKLELDNLIVIVDRNGIQGSGFTNNILSGSVLAMDAAAKESQWARVSLPGHDIDQLSAYLSQPGNIPGLVFAQTTKGKGVSFMENKPEWHAKWLDDDMEKLAMEELQ